MPNGNIPESYFVQVAAIPDAQSFLKLSRVLKLADREITGLAGTGLSTFIKFESASLAVFGSIGLGLVSLADKVAMTDQSYRLLGLRMLMTKESARAFQQALDEVGVTADEAAYDPESNKRVEELYNKNMELGRKLGDGFDKSAKSIRDIRQEYKMFGNEVEYLVAGVVTKLFTKLGFGSDQMMKKLEDLNQWFTDKIPEFSDAVSNGLIPVWNDAVLVFKDFGDILKDLGGDFSYFVGLLTGDSSIKDTEFSVRNLGKAFEDMMDLLAKSTLGAGVLFRTLLHFAVGVGEAANSGLHVLRGDVKGANVLSDQAYKEMLLGDSDVRAMYDPKLRSANPDWSNFQEFNERKSIRDNYDKIHDGDNSQHFDQAELKQYKIYIDQASKETGVDSELLAAQMWQESKNNAQAMSSFTRKDGTIGHAYGLMQLLPETAKEEGVRDVYDPKENIEGGAKYMAELFKRYKGDETKALAAYNAGSANVDKYGGVPPFKETQDYVERIQHEQHYLSQQSETNHGDTVIHGMTIVVPSGTPQQDIQQIIIESFAQQTAKATKNTMAQTAGGAYH